MIQWQILLCSKELNLAEIFLIIRPVVPGCAGCAMAHPDFGRSVNPILVRGDRLCQLNYYWHTRIFRPSNGPVMRVINFLLCMYLKIKIWISRLNADRFWWIFDHTDPATLNSKTECLLFSLYLVHKCNTIERIDYSLNPRGL